MCLLNNYTRIHALSLNGHVKNYVLYWISLVIIWCKIWTFSCLCNKNDCRCLYELLRDIFEMPVLLFYSWFWGLSNLSCWIVTMTAMILVWWLVYLYTISICIEYYRGYIVCLFLSKLFTLYIMAKKCWLNYRRMAEYNTLYCHYKRQFESVVASKWGLKSSAASASEELISDYSVCATLRSRSSKWTTSLGENFFLHSTVGTS